MLKRLLVWLGWYRPPCPHRYLKELRWNDHNGTPMIETSCLMCGRILDRGHIYGKPHTAEECGITYR